MADPGPPNELLARQAAWQRSLADLDWPAKIRWAAAVREALETLRGQTGCRAETLPGDERPPVTELERPDPVISSKLRAPGKE